MPNIQKQIASGKHAVSNFSKQHKTLTKDVKLEKALPSKKGYGHPIYKPALCDTLIEAGEKGLTLTQFCAGIGISIECFYKWRDSHPEFKDAVLIYKTKLDAWYTSLVKNKMLGMKQTANGIPINLDLGGLIWFGKNVCNWKDKQEQTISVGTQIVEVSKEENEMIS